VDEDRGHCAAHDGQHRADDRPEQGPVPTVNAWRFERADASRARERFAETIVTTYPVVGSPSPAMFFYDENGAWGREPRVVVRRTLFEYRGAWNKLYQYQLTEADKLNGIQFKGLAVLGAPAVQCPRLDSTGPASPATLLVGLGGNPHFPTTRVQF
jgi:hypothetical protein